MTHTYLLVRVRGGGPRRVRRAWCRQVGRWTSTTALCVTTMPRATTTASGRVRAVRPSSRGASKVRHKNIMYLCMCTLQKIGILLEGPLTALICFWDY